MVTKNIQPEIDLRNNLNQLETIKPIGKEQLALTFPKLFSGKLGCHEDAEVKLEVDESVKPVKKPLRPIAFH